MMRIPIEWVINYDIGNNNRQRQSWWWGFQLSEPSLTRRTLCVKWTFTGTRFVDSANRQIYLPTYSELLEKDVCLVNQPCVQNSLSCKFAIYQLGAARLSNKREVLKYIYEYRFLGPTYFASSFGPELRRCERPGRNNVHSTQFLKGTLITGYWRDRFHNQRRRRYRIYPLIERAIAQPHPLVSSSFS